MSRTLALSAVVLVLAAPRPTVAQGLTPTLTVGGQTATFSSAVALFDAGRARLSLLFPRVPLPPDVEAAARATGSWNGVAASVAPAVIADFDYTAGSTSGLVDALKGCRITAVGFTASWSVTGGAAQCHVVSIGGMLKSGGGIAGLLDGKGAGYALRLPFAGPLMEAANTSAAPLAVTAAVGAAASAPVVPLNTVAGTGTYQRQTVRVTHGLAWWDAKAGQVRLALFDHAPSAGMLAAARKGEFGEEAPVMDIYVGFNGSGRDLASADYCFVNVTFPNGGPIGTNTRPKGCGLDVLVTDGTPGGTVQAVLKGSGGGPAGPVAWDVTFHLPIAK